MGEGKKSIGHCNQYCTQFYASYLATIFHIDDLLCKSEKLCFCNALNLSTANETINSHLKYL